MKLFARNENKTDIVCILMAVKVVSDMFYQLQILDIILLTALGILLLRDMFTRKLNVCFCDILGLAMVALFTISFLKDPAYYRDYIKLVSAFLLYFLGRYHYSDADNITKSLALAYLAAFCVNLFWCLIGKGTIVWGHAITYRGTYFFKTDFTAMIAFFVSFYFIREKKFNVLDYVLLLVAGYFVVMSNARIYYLIFSVLIGCILLYKKKQKIFTVKTGLILVLFALIGVVSVMVIPRLPFFADRPMITLDFGPDAFTSNLQGRNNIWKPLFEAFAKESIPVQLFGAGLSFNDLHGLPGFNEHNTYVKIILNTGYVGLLLWFVFLIRVLVYLVKERNRKASWLCLVLIGIYSVAGLSVPANLFTNTSWFPLLYCGLICGIGSENQNEK